MRALQWVWDNREWLFSGIGIAAVTALVAIWRRRRARTVSSRPPIRQPHSGLEVMPVHFMIDLTRAVPQVEVELRAINYFRRPLALREVKITRFVAGSLPAIDNIPLAYEVTLEPQSSFLISCARALADSEARAAATAPPSSWRGSVQIVARGMVRGKEISFGPTMALKIEGLVLRPPAPPLRGNGS